MSINFRLHATLWESSAKLKTPSPALIRHIKHSFSFEINLIIRYAKGSNCKFQLPITLCHYQLFLTDIGPEVNIQEGFQIRGTCMMVSSLLATTAHSFCSLRRGSEISLFTFCLRPAQSAHPSMSNSPNESLIQGKDYKFPKLYPFHIDQWDFWSQGSVASISQASDWHHFFLKMIAFIQVKFAANTDVWAHGRVCPAARDGMKSQLLCGILVSAQTLSKTQSPLWIAWHGETKTWGKALKEKIPLCSSPCFCKGPAFKWRNCCCGALFCRQFWTEKGSICWEFPMQFLGVI